MATEEQIRELAYYIWEQEGCPEGKDLEHYFRAKKMLEYKEVPLGIQLTGAQASGQLTSPLGRRSFGSRKKR